MTMRAVSLALLFSSRPVSGLEDSPATSSSAEHLETPLKAEAAEETEIEPNSTERSTSASWYHRPPPPVNQADAYPEPFPAWLITETGQSNGSPDCNCPDAPSFGKVCTCVIFCNCPSEQCGGGDAGYNNCKGGFEQRQFWLLDSGSGSTYCHTQWVTLPNGYVQNWNWFYFFVPGIFTGKVKWDASKVRIALGGSKWFQGDNPKDSQLGAYCTGLPCGGYNYDATNGNGNGWKLDGYYYVRSFRVDTEFEDYNAGQPSTGNIAVKVVLFPQWNMGPYDEISCTDWNQPGQPWNYDVSNAYAKDHCVKGNCGNLIPRCASAIDRLYCMSVDQVWGGGEQDDIYNNGYDFADDIIIKPNWFPMLSAFADRYTGTFIPFVAPGNGKFCNPGDPNIYPNRGDCILTRFYPVNCNQAQWPYKSRGAAADGAAPFVLGCGTTVNGQARCGNQPGQGWGQYFNAGRWNGGNWVEQNWKIKCVWTRVVDQYDFDCNARLR